MNAPLRPFASPYARKLARERGIALVDLSGSGPSGRIVAADILSFVVPSAIATAEVSASASADAIPSVASTPAVFVAAIATGIDLGPLQQLLAQFAGAELPLSLDVMFVRAVGRGIAQGAWTGGIGWETGHGADRQEIEIADAANLSLGAIRKQIETSSSGIAGRDQVLLSIRHISHSGIRAVSTPLLPDHKLRLIFSTDGAESAECLLCFDSSSIDEDDAVAFLAELKDDLEAPLRLLA